jgi:hypothetical protein
MLRNGTQRARSNDLTVSQPYELVQTKEEGHPYGAQ